MMGPTDQEFSEPPAGRLAATDAERERVAAAERAGWTILYDPMRDEFTAAREARTARTLGEVLNLAEAADAKAASAKRGPVTPRQAATLRARIEARWPDATEVQVTPDSDGAHVRMTMDGEDYGFSVPTGGALMRLLLTGSARRGAPGAD